MPYSHPPCPATRETSPCNSKHSTKSSAIKMQICVHLRSCSQRKGTISYLFTVQSRFNQICFALLLVKMFLFSFISFFSIYANKKLLKKKAKRHCRCTASVGIFSALQLTLGVQESMTAGSARVSAHV